MTTQNAAAYLPAVEALRDGELEERFAHGWEFVIHADFAKPPDHYRRRPKPLEFWVGYYGTNMFGPIRDSYEETDKITIRQGLIKIVHLREVRP